MLALLLACAATPAPAPQAAAPAPAAVAAPEPAPTGSTLTVQISSDTARFTAVELVCPSGYRQRAALTGAPATFGGVPDGACTLHFKGGPPAMFSPVTAGDWQCSFAGSTVTCTAS